MSKKPQVVLTFDDGPSNFTRELVDFLYENDIQAVFFVRGGPHAEQDMPYSMSDPKYFEKIVYAIEKGMVIGNHAYSHKRMSTLTLDEAKKEVLDTEKLIDRAYAEAKKRNPNIERPYKCIRFPHMDVGCGGWIIDYDAVADKHRDTVINLFKDGVRIKMDRPTDAQKQLKADLDKWLKEEGFIIPPFDELITHDWYRETPELAESVQWEYTFSTCDWKITERHADNGETNPNRYQTIDDLKRRIDEDVDLNDPDSLSVVLAHDQDELVHYNIELIKHMIDRGFEFFPVVQRDAPSSRPGASASGNSVVQAPALDF